MCVLCSELRALKRRQELLRFVTKEHIRFMAASNITRYITIILQQSRYV